VLEAEHVLPETLRSRVRNPSRIPNITIPTPSAAPKTSGDFRSLGPQSSISAPEYSIRPVLMRQWCPVQLFSLQTPLWHESVHVLPELIIVMAFQQVNHLMH